MTGLATIDVTAVVKFLASGLTGMQAQAACRLRSLRPDIHELNISSAGFPFIDLKLTETFYQRQ